MKIKNYRIIVFIIIFFLSATLFAKDQLIFAVTVIRHGDRTPYAKLVSTVINFDDVWPEGVGMLTPTGMNQEYFLGQKVNYHQASLVAFDITRTISGDDRLPCEAYAVL